jgi:cyclin-dependent kinase-like
MEAFDLLGTIGEGTYGVVLKARHRESGQIVAIKKFKESDEDEQVRKTALREVRILKQLRHENVVSLIEVFRRKRKLYLVFEYVESTLLEELERHPDGLDPQDVRRIMWQLCRGVEHLHAQNVIHRDLKPENLLLSKHGVLKLCDFGFARTLGGPGARYTDYVSTRWYRCPELLIGDTAYGKAVDMWALGCLMAEISNGLPLFPGDSDVDQLFSIMKVGGALAPRALDTLRRNPLFAGVKVPDVPHPESLEKRLPTLDPLAIDVIRQCLRYEPLLRASAADILRHPYFAGLEESFGPTYKVAVEKDAIANALGRRAQAAAVAPAKPVAAALAPAASTSAVRPAPTAAASYLPARGPPQGLDAPSSIVVGGGKGGPPHAPSPTAPAPGVGRATKGGKGPALSRGREDGDSHVESEEQRAGSEGAEGLSMDDASSLGGGDVMSQLSSRIAAAAAAGNMRRDRPMNSGSQRAGQPGFGSNSGALLPVAGVTPAAIARVAGGPWPADIVRGGEGGSEAKHPTVSPLGSRRNSAVAPGAGLEQGSVGGFAQTMAHGRGTLVTQSYSSSYAAPSAAQAARERREKEGDETGPSGSPPPPPSQAQAAMSPSSSSYAHASHSYSPSGIGGASPLGRRAPMDPFARMSMHAGQSGLGLHRFTNEREAKEEEEGGWDGHGARGQAPAPQQQQHSRATGAADAWAAGGGTVARAAPPPAAVTAPTPINGTHAQAGYLGPGRMPTPVVVPVAVAQGTFRRADHPAPAPAPPTGLQTSSIEDTLASLGLGKGDQGGRSNIRTRGRERDKEGVPGDGRDRSPAGSLLSQSSGQVGGRLGAAQTLLGPSGLGNAGPVSGDGYGKPLGGGEERTTSLGGMLYGGGMQIPFVIGTGSPGLPEEEGRLFGGGAGGSMPQGGLFTEDSLYATLRNEMASRARDREAAAGRERERAERRRAELAQGTTGGGGGQGAGQNGGRGLTSREGRDPGRSTLQSRGASVVGMGLGGIGSDRPGGGRDIAISITGMAAASNGKPQQGGGAGYVQPANGPGQGGARYAAAAPAGLAISGGGGLGGGLSVTAIRRGEPSLGRPSVASSHGIPVGLQSSHGLSQGVMGLAQTGRVGAGGSYVQSYGAGAGYRAMREGGGGMRSSLGLPMSLQGASTGTLRYPGGPGMGMVGLGTGVGVGGMRAVQPTVQGLGPAGIHGYALHGRR